MLITEKYPEYFEVKSVEVANSMATPSNLTKLLEQLFDWDGITVPKTSKLQAFFEKADFAQRFTWNGNTWAIDHQKLMTYLNTLPGKAWL